MTDQKLLVLIPIYEDWEPVSMLLRSLNTELAQEGLRGRVLLVDDGSKTPYQSKLEGLVLERGAIERIDVLRLRRKLGHQRAIAVGLCHVAESVDANTITVMDGDGQDAPATSRGWWQRQENIGAKGSSSQKAGAGRRASCCVSSTIIIAWFTDS